MGAEGRYGVGNWDELDDSLDEPVEDDVVFDDGAAIEEIDDTEDIEADDGLTEEARAELEALAAAEGDMHAALEEALAETKRALDEQREATRAAVARYREALLAAEPDLPPDLVAGDTLEDLDASVRAARQAVAQIRERLASEVRAEASRGFPVGTPARGPHSTRGLSSAEKIAAGLSERLL